MGFEWAKILIRNLKSLKYSFNGVTTALYERLRLEDEESARITPSTQVLKVCVLSAYLLITQKKNAFFMSQMQRCYFQLVRSYFSVIMRQKFLAQVLLIAACLF